MHRHLLTIAHATSVFALLSFSLTHAQDSPSKTSADNFTTLVNGDSLDGWKNSGNWSVKDGVITRDSKGGDLIYVAEKVPNNFELTFEWKVAPGSNSGIYYRPTQYEYQILDNSKHKDGRNPRTSAASLYFCMQPSADHTKPVGQWNSGRVVCKGTIIQHWLNGEKVVHLDYADPKQKFHVDLLSQRGGDLTARGANLRLQDHGDPVWYRNLKIREIGEDESIDMQTVVPQSIDKDVLAAEAEKLRGIVERRNRARK